MYNFMEIHKDVGVSTCPLFLPSGELDKACRRSFPTISNSIGKLLNLSKFSDKFKGYNIEGSINREIEIDACTGAFMFIRKEVFSGNKKHTKTAFFDESFWAMGEDLDLCFRIKENNWKIMYTPKTSILHYKGASGGLKKSSSKLSSADKETKRRWIKAYSDAMYIFYKKHYFTQNNVLINFIIIISIKLLYLLQLLKLNVIEK